MLYSFWKGIDVEGLSGRGLAVQTFGGFVLLQISCMQYRYRYCLLGNREDLA